MNSTINRIIGAAIALLISIGVVTSPIVSPLALKAGLAGFAAYFIGLAFADGNRLDKQ